MAFRAGAGAVLPVAAVVLPGEEVPAAEAVQRARSIPARILRLPRLPYPVSIHTFAA